MKKVLIFISLLLTFVNVTGQNQINVVKAYVRDWIIYKGDTLAVTAVAHAAAWDTLFVTKGSILDTVIVSRVRELDNLSDVVLTTPDASDMLILDDETMKWVNRPLIQVYDSMQREAAAAPTPYTTWVRDTANGELYPADTADKVGIGTTTPTQPLDVRGNTYFYNNTVTGTEPNYFKTELTSMSGNQYNLRSTAYMNNPARITYRIGGLLGEVNIDTTAEYIWNAVGQYGYIQHHGTDTLHLGSTFFGYCTNRNTGTMDIASVFWANAFENSGGGSIPVAYQLYLADNAGVPGIGNLYGIYQAGRATNYFGGNLQLSESTDTTGIIYKGGSTFIHNYAPTTADGYNTFVGRDAGPLTMAGTGGESSKNTGVGYDALGALTTGYGNAALGAWALKLNTTGYNNTGVGYNALGSNLIGNNNTAVGNAALVANTGNFNTAVGNQSATANAGGGYNTSIGYRSLYTNVSGNYNVAVGHEALKVSTSSNNTVVGMRAAIATTSGGNNTYLGFNSGYSNVTGSNNIGIGYRGGYNETGSYKFYLAGDSTSWANGMASGSKLLMYADQSNAAKSNHFLNIFAKVSIGAAKDPTEMLSVTGNASITGYLKSGTGSIADNDSTPSVASYNTFIYAGSANPVSIDALDDHVVGCYYTIIGNSNTYTITVIDGTPAGGDSFNLAGGNWVGGSQDVLLLYCIAADAFVEVSRSDN